MKRILTLSSNDFYTGISAGAHVDRGGLFATAEGINAFVDLTQDTTQAGLLQTCATPSDITGSMQGSATDYAVNGTEMWLVADSGDICSIDLTSDTLTVEIDQSADGHSSTTNFQDIGSGCDWFTGQQGGTSYLYYHAKVSGTWYLGRVSAGGSDADNWQTFSRSTALPIEPVLRFKDRLYTADLDTTGSRNEYCVSSVHANSSGSATFTQNVLDLPPDMAVTALAEDGTYLIVAGTTNTGLDATVYGDTRIFFWDTNQASWTREFRVRDSYISKMKRVGDRIYAVGARGLWVFSFQSRPYKIRALGSSDVGGTHGAISDVNNAVLWGDGGNSGVWSYGELLQGIGVDNVLHRPFAYSGQDYATTMVAADARLDKVYTGNSNDKLYSWDVASGGQTGLSATTVYIPLSEQTHIREVEIVLGEPLASGDSLNIDLRDDADTAATDWGTVSFATHGAVQRVKLKGSKRKVDNLQMVLNFNGGNVKIKRINVYGTREVVAPK